MFRHQGPDNLDHAAISKILGSTVTRLPPDNPSAAAQQHWATRAMVHDSVPRVTEIVPDGTGGDRPVTGMSAIISPCGTYRYDLVRDFTANPGPGPGRCLFVMLNPSTADATTDDATVRRCVSFAQAWGYTGLAIINLFAFRATDPRKLLDPSVDPVGPANDAVITAWVDPSSSAAVVCAWGAGASTFVRARAHRVLTMVRDAKRSPLVLRLTKDGQPAHPLYLPKNLIPNPWILPDSFEMQP